MSSQDYATSITVDRTPAYVFDAITDPRRWWSGEFEGPTDEVGGVFSYRYEDLHISKQKVTELMPGKRVVWLVVEGGPTFVAAKNEWKGTRIIFDIAEKGNGTELRFTHEGLIPRLECYDNCTDVWGSIIRDDLRTLIETRMPQSRQLERHVEDLRART
jgi:hypothetical protein